MAKQPLEIGKRIWIEMTSSFFRSTDNKRKIHEYEIVDANKSSAYAVAIDRLGEYKEDPKGRSYIKKRIEQRTYRVQGDGFGGHYKLWFSPEAFEKNVAYNKEIKEIRKQAHDKIDKLSLSELKEFMSKFN